MKQEIIRLLLEEYKQNCFFNEMAERGIDLRSAAINIYDIIFDIIGFPKEGTVLPLNLLINNPGYNKESVIDNLFTRDYLYDKYNDTFDFQTGDIRS